MLFLGFGINLILKLHLTDLVQLNLTPFLVTFSDSGWLSIQDLITLALSGEVCE